MRGRANNGLAFLRRTSGVGGQIGGAASRRRSMGGAGG
jgi:hypothetical protein